ncbi:MAG: serine hydrolase [Bacteroidetes bacterium]|nr:serine hydrolase [Bacteroidota bacterium]
MKQFRLFYLGLFSVMFIASCSKESITKSEVCNASENHSGHPKSELFNSILNKAVADGFPGIALLVVDSNGTYVGSAGYADIKNKIKMQPCHISKVASLTKIFIGVLAFKMQEEGKLDLDKKISEYLDSKELEGIANANEVTVRQLMMHNTGIFDVITDTKFYLDILNNPPRHRNQMDILEYVRGKKSLYTPGNGPSYSNTNTLLLSMVIDKIGGKPHQELLHEKILEPLGLNNTYYFYHDPLPEGKVAQGYYDLYNNGRLENLSSYNTGSGNGYTGIYSNVFDLRDFIDALLIHKTLLTTNSLNQMLIFGKSEKGYEERELGAGIMKDFLLRTNPKEYAYGHRGRDLGYTADLFYFPEYKQTLALIINYGTDGDSRLRPLFYELRKSIVDAMMQH